MRTIHKFTARTYPGIQAQDVRGLIRWLDAGEQDGGLVLWAEVDTDLDTGRRYEIAVEWTGHPRCCGLAGWRFLRTVQIGPLVHHVFVRSDDA